MKKLIRLLALILVAATLFSLSACGGKEPATETVPAKETKAPAAVPEETESKEEKNTEPVVYTKVEKPLSQADFDAIPIAKSSMSTDELRKICLQYVALSVAFPWVPDVTHSYTVERQVYDVTYKEGELYAGIPYVNVASGNAYRWFEFYDSETGVFKLSKTFVKDNGLWGTACSGTACWGWGRVVNSANYSWTAAMTQKNGFIPVGSFQYSPEINRYGEDGFPDCKDIAKENGAEVMYESYAKLLPADCLVNNGHVRMNAAVPTVVRDENGKIDPQKSYTLWSDQGMYRNLDYQIRTQSDGTTYSIQGGVEVKMTFAELYSGGYLPHTFAEFLGTDPVEDGVADLGLTGDSASIAEIKASTMKANYAISDIFFLITNKDGKVVFNNIQRAKNHFTYTWELEKIFAEAIASRFTDGEHTITISCQLSNGEKVVSFKGILTA